MRSEKEILKKIEEIRKEYDWMSRCQQEGGMGKRVGCMMKESRDKAMEKLKNQIEILEWILEK